MCAKSLIAAVPLFFASCGPAPQQAVPAAPAPVLRVSIGNLSRDASDYLGQTVRVKVAAGGYRSFGRTIIVPAPHDPSLNLLVFYCRDAAPDDASKAVTIQGTVRAIMRDGRDRGAGVAGEVGVMDCTVTPEP